MTHQTKPSTWAEQKESDHGVKLPSERAAELMRDNGELMNVILERKAAIMAEGYTEEQALRAIAHQMGVSA